ncbi:DNA (cytosine-5)-methyltransferase 1 [Marinilactibacillus piezotolerans]|uniref:Cytosine-specific methyltransferase n=1 Tax=Marinilactibacillus piezotolerans TaxID=258723 RepID=A0A1I4BU74_9LACT|nr:DNA cytosine methyltransferase [Marinilactibacillus piezotolerans]SFK72334.1 DNA (cytosine-5)-methyltransferase 1 [Marinilactibacillus piezotolerans]
MTNSVSSTKSRSYTLSAFFSGVGGIELGFERTGEFRVVYANEYDKNAQITYEQNHPHTPLDKRDIHEVLEEEIPYSDIIVGGFPCQAFSIAGYRKGFEDDRGDLFFELLRIIKSNKPKAIFIENVKNMVTHDHGNTFKIIREALTLNGYYIKWQVLNGKDYGNIPQNRERIYIVGFRNKAAFKKFHFPEKINLTKSIRDVINFDSEMESKYYYIEGKQPFYDKLAKEVTDENTIYQWRRHYVRENKSGVVPTLTANMGTGGHNVPIIKTKTGIRKLTPYETFRVQGFPESFKLPKKISNGQLYKQAGNSVVVPVIQRIAENISLALSNINDLDESILDIKYKYYIMHTKMEGRFKGESYLVQTASSDKELEKFSKDNGIKYLSNKEYFKKIKRNIMLDFYSFE